MHTPKWQITSQEYFERLSFTTDEFEKRLRLPNIKTVKKILPLRDLKTVEAPPIPISKELLLHLIRRLKTMDGREPFANAAIQLVKIDPRHLKIGQRFVYRENYLSILEETPGEFFATTGGFSALGAYFVFGCDEQGDFSLSCYIPPLIEKHGSDLVIMDGIHRSYIAKQAGSILNAIIIDGVGLPFPCSARDWSEIKVISLKDKPKDINERYFDLQKDLFRDLKYLGIDG